MFIILFTYAIDNMYFSKNSNLQNLEFHFKKFKYLFLKNSKFHLQKFQIFICKNFKFSIFVSKILNFHFRNIKI